MAGGQKKSTKNANPPPKGGNGAGGGPTRKWQFWHGVAYLIVGLIALYLFQVFLLGPITSHETEIGYSEFKGKVSQGQIFTALIGASRITGTMKSPDPKETDPVDYRTNYQAQADPDLVSELNAAGVEYSFTGASSPIGGILISLLPFILIGVIWFLVFRRMGGGLGGGLFGVGKTKATKVTAEQVGVTFKDVGHLTRLSPSFRRSSSSSRRPKSSPGLADASPRVFC
jgi:cell division protease FtsH